MRELRSRLKVAGERLQTLTRFPEQPAAFLRQGAEALRDRARQFRPRGASPVIAEQAEAAAPRWQGAWSRPVAQAPAQAAAESSSADTEAEASWQERLPAGKQVLRTLVLAVMITLGLPYLLIPIYRFVDPPFSSLMTRQFLTGVNVRQQWVDFEDIAPALPRAVVLSEDAAFCRHWGVDWNAVGDALEDGNGVRGASTIPMQTAKNLFLWNGHSYIRKVMEVPLAYTMSLFWPKRRMLEIYLNLAEWGPGVFGAEAAARYHFGKSAAMLSPREASLLAAALPNPIKRNAGRPNGLTARVAAHIGARASRESQDAACVFPRG